MRRAILALCAAWLAACTRTTSPSAPPVVFIGGGGSPIISKALIVPSDPFRAKNGAGASVGKRVPSLTASEETPRFGGLVPLSGSYRLKRNDVVRTAPRSDSEERGRLAQGSLVEAKGVLSGWLWMTTELDGRPISGWIPLFATQADARGP